MIPIPVPLSSVPPRASLNVERAPIDAIVTVTRSALHLEACVPHEEPEVHDVIPRREVRLQLELVVVHEQIVPLPERERVLALHRLVVAVVPAMEAVDVNER